LDFVRKVLRDKRLRLDRCPESARIGNGFVSRVALMIGHTIGKV
jgi:hypothetical protein